MKVKAAYSIRELAELTGLSRWQVHRMVRRSGMEVLRLGDHVLVPLLAFRLAYPELWSSMALKADVERLGRGAERERFG